ncbi:hypothetical protein A5791_12530 [Mycobacterium sp. 852002-51163_SCH5372311]|uniref:hypothetical protein n=1 Tax=Mycobacterium sp. 852002-51163_SCH5372311 TaxID=1834097 RepID=UPI0007FDABE1|nr:hypothetical protein [Mycobacterium sp. 852002-51163_SCH5372311]OBF93335.1 hypothetical protein A5791_12530 [Mycobacterium sp. 852002-51163_SCH5372311]
MTSWNEAPWDRRFASGNYAPPVEPTPRWPSFGRVVASIFLVASAACLLASVVLAGWLAVAGSDLHTSLIAYLLASFTVFLFHGPLLVLDGWPISVPVIAALGVLLAYLRRRPGVASDRFAAPRRVGFALLIAYGILLTAAWTVLLLGALYQHSGDD